MSEQDKEQQNNEQLKAQNLFAKWRKHETLYKEDEKDQEKHSSNENESK